ncbi:cupin (plasmid) [Novosphingobium sp. BL-8A]|uniref:cupin n=1 Tax=Novosphingobium sp. BL-8A TaxID=3127639 RepID=UPI0037568B75
MMPEAHLLDPNDWIPNNQRLPVLIYRDVEGGDCETVAKAFERRFREHGWPPRWRDTIFDYHHYHSTAHEALGIASGSGTLMIGGPGTLMIHVVGGDCLVLPAGTGHCLISASRDFLVVGAYPCGQDWDICRESPSKAALDRIRTMPPADRNPLDGQPFKGGSRWNG